MFKGWYCQCRSGAARMVGTLVHVASAVWFLGVLVTEILTLIAQLTGVHISPMQKIYLNPSLSTMTIK
jgi:hypothetical protein